MAQRTSEYALEFEKEISSYLARIRQIDRILKDPVKTLIKIAQLPPKPTMQFFFPSLISDKGIPEYNDNLFSHALCCATLQRLQRLQRRFTWLSKADKLNDELQRRLVESFIPSDASEFSRAMQLLRSETFGSLNPLTASQVFRVLLEAGEARAHSGIGFLAFFAMIWQLYRQYPDRLSIGARIEPWETSAYVTANCIIPIKILQNIALHRADLFERIAGKLAELESLREEAEPNTDGKTGSEQANYNSRWLFNAGLDDLRTLLVRLSRVAIVKEAFEKCAEEVGKKSADLTIITNNHETYTYISQLIGETLKSIPDKSAEALRGAESVVSSIKSEIIKHLSKDHYKLLQANWHLKFAGDYLDDETYWADLKQAAEQAFELCKKSVEKLKHASDACGNVKPEHPASVRKILQDLAASNKDLATSISAPVDDAARWCRNVVDREIAHASAKNFTDFDPAELVSAIAVSVRWNLLTTPPQVSDAVCKALAGVQEDGSWRPGQPFFSPNNELGSWAGTSDIVWTLTSAISYYPEVDVADEKIFLYLDWLDRTQMTFNPQIDIASPSADKEIKKLPISITGWSADRLRDHRKIHLATTTYSINALIDIRNMVEYRLWQLCEKRFSTVPHVRPLSDVEPVDLGAQHEHRLHSILASMARKAQSSDYTNAQYSLVLHGPPGSSKTKVAEGLSVEMWRSASRWGSKTTRLIRVTPADFTRLGEDRLDSEARLIFDLLRHVRAVTILFDEIDDLLHRRDHTGDSRRFMDLVVPAMLNRLADLRDACPRQEICFLLATNYIENIEPALIRKGRIDRVIPVVYPDQASRRAMVNRHSNKLAKDAAQLKGDPSFHVKRYTRAALNAYADYIASKTPAWPWMATETACKEIVEQVENYFEGAFEEQSPRVVATEDIVLSAEQKSKLEKLIDETIKENENSFSSPSYNSRLEHKHCTQELLHEYTRHVISSIQADVPVKDSRLLLDAVKNGETRLCNMTIDDFVKRVEAILVKEGRIIIDRSPASGTGTPTATAQVDEQAS